MRAISSYPPVHFAIDVRLVLMVRCIHAIGQETSSFTLPLGECVGPFGKPRPWGSFTCAANNVPAAATTVAGKGSVSTGASSGNPCGGNPSDPLPLKNMTVVITSGSGGTGYLGIQMARALGASKIITAATGAKAIAWMQSLGADVVIDYKERDIFEVLEDDSVDAVYDNYGGNGTADRAMPKLRTGGVYLLLPHGDSAGALSKHPKAGVR